MKRIQIRALTLAILLTLTLCLLPAAAGAYKLDRDELRFTVGEKSTEKFYLVKEDGDPQKIGYDVFGCTNWEFGLQAGHSNNDNSFYVEGTPTRKGDYIGRLKVFLWGGGEIELPIRIIIREKETPVTPVVPTVVDNVIYNAAPEHEQALIRGVKEWCNVRAGAGTDSAVIGRANLGQQISLLRWNTDESWCFVEFNGLQGWIAKQFILPIK